jgi:UDP-N-acetylmuramate dehydrogenase
MAGAGMVGLLEELGDAFDGRVRPNESLARHTSFRIGGPAELLVVPDSPAELGHVVRAAAARGLPVTLLGGGSNVLVGDGGIAGVVVKLGRGFAGVEWGEAAAGLVRVRAGAAHQLAQLARAAARRGLAGLEHAEGIPGTVGGAVFMNAGAYGGDIAGVAEAVEGVDAGGTLRTLGADALAFRYRRAELPRGFVVTAVRMCLREDPPDAVRARLAAARERRIAAQPRGSANAGSMFKNPTGDHAGRLIDTAGLKGTRVGRARISEEHANFIVNEGGASAVDVKALMELVQRVVWEGSGVWLEPEVRFVGTW